MARVSTDGCHYVEFIPPVTCPVAIYHYREETTTTSVPENETSTSQFEKEESSICLSLKRAMKSISANLEIFWDWFSECTRCPAEYIENLEVPIPICPLDRDGEKTEMYSSEFQKKYSLHNFNDFPIVKGFTPVEEFTINHLPDRYKDEELLQRIKVMSELTVALHVQLNSIAVNCLGTGLVVGIERPGRGKCYCHKCKTLDVSARSDKWWLVVIRTAHNIPNHAKFLLRVTGSMIARDGDFPELTVKGKGGWFKLHGSIRDLPELRCATCDEDMISRLYQMRATYNTLHRRCVEKFTDDTGCDNCLGKKRPHISFYHKHVCRVAEGRNEVLNSNDCDCHPCVTTFCFGIYGGYTISV